MARELDIPAARSQSVKPGAWPRKAALEEVTHRRRQWKPVTVARDLFNINPGPQERRGGGA